MAKQLPGKYDLTNQKLKSAGQEINSRYRLSGEPENRVALVANKQLKAGDIICLMSGDLASTTEQYQKNNAHLMDGVILHPRLLFLDCSNKQVVMDCSTASV